MVMDFEDKNPRKWYGLLRSGLCLSLEGDLVFKGLCLINFSIDWYYPALFDFVYLECYYKYHLISHHHSYVLVH